jgi:hypothetical protein
MHADKGIYLGSPRFVGWKYPIAVSHIRRKTPRVGCGIASLGFMAIVIQPQEYHVIFLTQTDKSSEPPAVALKIGAPQNRFVEIGIPDTENHSEGVFGDQRYQNYQKYFSHLTPILQQETVSVNKL